MSPLQTLLFESAGGVATITLNRPERLNAFNRQMVIEFRQLWQHLRHDPEVRVVEIGRAHV